MWALEPKGTRCVHVSLCLHFSHGNCIPSRQHQLRGLAMCRTCITTWAMEGRQLCAGEIPTSRFTSPPTPLLYMSNSEGGPFYPHWRERGGKSALWTATLSYFTWCHKLETGYLNLVCRFPTSEFSYLFNNQKSVRIWQNGDDFITCLKRAKEDKRHTCTRQWYSKAACSRIHRGDQLQCSFVGLRIDIKYVPAFAS